MNAITATVAACKTTLDRHAAEHARGRAAEPALAPYRAARDVLDALDVSSPLSRPARDAIVLALVRRHRASARPHALWQSILVVAYAPMLYGVKRRTLGAAKDEASQLALVAFLEAIANVNLESPPQLLSLALRHETERRAFRGAGRHAEPETIPLVEARREPDPRDPFARVDDADRMRAVFRALVRMHRGDEALARETLDALVRPRSELDARGMRLRDRALAHLGPQIENVRRTA